MPKIMRAVMSNRVSVILIVAMALANFRGAIAGPIDGRPYPLLEFFLAQECIDGDLQATALIETLARSSSRSSQLLHRAYRLVSEARAACAADRVGRALQQYQQVIGWLCEQPKSSTVHDRSGGQMLCETPELWARKASGKD